MLKRAIFLLLLSLAACKTTHYAYTPPGSEVGRLCVTNCAGIKETCMGNEMRRASHEKDRCESTSENMFNNCMRKAKNKEDEKQCDKKRSICGAYENTDRCETDFRGCYVSCGGQIQEYTK